ncbi:MAG: general secretion pathway protein GspB [Acidobacteriota bacterium]
MGAPAPHEAENQESSSPVPLSVSSILYSPDRRLAIMEGQVLGVGDTVAGMTIVEIQPSAVILRDRAGRLRRAQLR